MIEVKTLMEYDPGIADEMGKLLCQLSSSYDGSAVSREVIEDIIDSPWHDILLAVDDNDAVIGMASLSVIMGTKIEKNLYLEDFVVSEKSRGQGVGSMLWDAMLEWGRNKGCKRFEFTSSGKGNKANAVQFYLDKGAEIRETNAFRVEL